MDQLIFVTGMFRSGTTLLSVMLNAHPDVSCANDPYLPIFKTFRNAVERSVQGNKLDDSSRARPLDYYYFEPKQLELMEAIQNTGLDLKATDGDLEEIRSGVKSYAEEFSPKLADLSGRLTGSTFSEILKSAFELVHEAYGENATHTVGFKAAWTDEFVPHVLEAFPNAKVIQILRDPRAVCASKNARSDKYPWLFLTRHWRKLAACAWVYNNTQASWSDRYLLVKYEDIVALPEESALLIGSFLNTSSSDSFADTSRFKDEAGNKWTSNSSHFSNTKGFNVGSLERWKGILSEREATLVEYLCAPEMELHGYSPRYDLKQDFPSDFILDPPVVSPDNLAGWIQPYSTQSIRERIVEMSLEAARFRLRYLDDLVSKDLQKHMYLYPSVFNEVQKV